jgi:hypothetical protein
MWRNGKKNAWQFIYMQFTIPLSYHFLPHTLTWPQSQPSYLSHRPNLQWRKAVLPKSHILLFAWGVYLTVRVTQDYHFVHASTDRVSNWCWYDDNWSSGAARCIDNKKHLWPHWLTTSYVDARLRLTPPLQAVPISTSVLIYFCKL